MHSCVSNDVIRMIKKNYVIRDLYFQKGLSSKKNPEIQVKQIKLAMNRYLFLGFFFFWELASSLILKPSTSFVKPINGSVSFKI